MNSTDVKVDFEPVYAEVTCTPTNTRKELVTLEPHVVSLSMLCQN